MIAENKLNLKTGCRLRTRVVGVQWYPEKLVRLDNGAGRAALGTFQGFAEALAGR